MYETRPRIKISPTRIQTAVEVLTVGILLAMLFYVWQAWPTVPEQIPQKFDIKGQPIRWGGRNGLWLLPGLSLGIYALMSLLQRMPHLYNYPADLSAEEAPRLYAIGVSLIIWMKLQVVGLLALMCWRQIEVATGGTSALPSWIVPALLTLNLGTIAFHVLRMRAGRRQA